MDDNDVTVPDPREALLERQRKTRAEGRCGSLQTQSGEPCRRVPKPGYTVCKKHGERAPQVRAKAERLLAIARTPAIEWIMDALDQAQEETCPTCGFPAHGLKERKRLDSLAFKLLDRTGFGPRSTIDFNARSSEPGIDLSQLTEQEMLVLDSLLEAMDRFKSRVLARQARDGAQGLLAPEPTRVVGLPSSSEPSL